MITNYKNAVENIRRELKHYVMQSGLKSLVVGMSGGIDSALTAALAKPVCEELGIPLIGRSITILTNKPDEIERARQMGRFFCTDFEDVNLSHGFELLAAFAVEEWDSEDRQSFDFKIRMGNIKARTRMVYLYDLAAKHKGMVLSTDNYTELLLGFWTLHGDVGDYGMIQNLWKTEVYEMARYMASQMADTDAAAALLSCVNAVPTDGLGITNSDLDQIKAGSYEEVDQILIEMMRESEKGKSLENHPVVQRNRRSEFKRSNPYNLPRNMITETPLY